MASAIPVPEQPGRLFIPATGDVIQQESQYEGDYYDTVEFTSFAVGQKQDAFKVQTNKELHHTNMTQVKRIPSMAKIKVLRISAHVRQWVGGARPSPDDVVALYELGNLRFLLGSTNVIAEGPLLAFPGGIGVTGVSNSSDFSILTLGVPSAAAAPKLLEQQDINDKMDLNCVIRTDAQTWLTIDNGQPGLVGNGVAAGSGHIAVSVLLHGLIVRPLGS